MLSVVTKKLKPLPQFTGNETLGWLAPRFCFASQRRRKEVWRMVQDHG